MMAGFGCVSQDASVHFISPLFSMKVSSTPHIQKEWQQIRVREEKKKTTWFSLVQNECCFQFRGHEYNFILAKKKKKNFWHLTNELKASRGCFTCICYQVVRYNLCLFRTYRTTKCFFKCSKLFLSRCTTEAIVIFTWHKSYFKNWTVWFIHTYYFYELDKKL